MRNLTRTLLVPLLLVALSACQAGPQAGGSRLLIDHADAHKLGYSLAWSSGVGVPADQNLAFANVMGDLLILVEIPENLVTAVSLRDGAPVWRRIVGDRNDRLFEPVRVGDKLVINSQYELFILNINSGSIEATQKLEGVVQTGAVVVEDLALFGSLNHRFFAHSLTTGFSSWAYKMSGQIVTRTAVQPPYAFIADATGVYALFSALTGELLWKGRTFGAITAQPLITRHGILVPSEDHSLYALQVSGGKDRWIYRATAPLTLDPVGIGNNIYLPIPGQGIVVIDSYSGKQLWQLQSDAEPVRADDARVLFNNHTTLMILDALTGRLLQEVPVRRLLKVLDGPDKSLVLITKAGRLARLNKD